jgi:chitodextrinase
MTSRSGIGWIAPLFAVLVTAHASFGQTDSLVLSSGTTAANGTVSLNLSLTSPTGNEPAAVQWMLTFPPSNVVSISAAPGLSATNASKTLICSLGSGTYTCVASGMNAGIITNGTLAVVNLTIASGITTTAIGVSNTLGTSPSANAITVSPAGGVVTGGGLPTVSSLACNPTSLGANASSSCTVTLSGAAPVGGALVSLGSNQLALTVPGTVTVGAGLTTASFNATTTTVTSSQTATVTASYNSSSAPATINLDITPPTVSITTPVANATVSTTVTVTATASDNVAVGDVQFQLDGVNLGPDLTTSPYSILWNTTTASNGSHNLTAIAHDTSHNAATSAIVPVTVSNTTGAPPTNGLIGYWNFDEGTGSVAHDTSGSGYNGVVSGATWTAGKINSALSFGVNTNSVTTPSIALGKTFSLTAWVNPTVIAQASYVRIAETYYATGFYVGTNAAGTAYKLIMSNGSGVTGSCGGLVFGCAEGGTITSGWHLVTATYDGATARLYVDNALVGSDTFTAPGNTNLPLSIGHSSYGNAFNGAIDEVRLYNRALTATEVSTIYNYSGTPDTTPPTVPSNVSAAAVSSSQINVSWTASTDNVGVVGYRVYRNGNLAGATSSLSYLDTGLTASTLYSYTVAAYDGAGNVSGQSAAATATTLIPDTTPPTVSITAPVANATVSTTVTVTATASDNVAVGDVQFQLDGVNLGADLTAPPYSISWDTTTASNGSHNLTAIAHDTSHNAATSAIVPVTVSNTTGSVPTNGLIGYWNFDEGTGSVAHDTSGSGYNGVVSGATWTTGKINSALNFGVNTNSVTTPSIALGKTFSLTAWVNSTALVQASYVRIAETYYATGLYVGTNALGTGYKLIVNNGAGATGVCGVILGCAEGGLITSGWHLVTATYDGATGRLYVDTVLVGTDTFTAPGNTSLPLSIGHSSYGNAFNGVIDEVRLYNRALTGTEVTAIYNYTGQDTIPPSVPSNVSAVAVSGSQINVSWSASTDNVGVAGYRVYRNGSLAGTTGSLSYSDTGLTAATLYSYTVAAYDAAGNVSGQSAAATATTPDTIPPTVSITAPVANATVSTTVTVTATASDNVAVGDVQFQLDGVNLGPDLTTPPYSILWDTTTASNGNHNLTAIAHDTSHNAATSAIVPVKVSNTTGPPTNGLIGYWNFDEDTGSVAHDTSGSGYNGVVSGATWTTGKINSALNFSVNTNSVTTPNIALGKTFSLTAWVNPTVLTQASYVRIAENYYWSGLYVGANAAGTAYKIIVNNGAGATGTCGVILGCAEGGTITSGWHLVTATYDGATARLYVDNALVGSDTFTAPGNTTLPLSIGHSSYGNAFNGAIDEVRLYNRALTATEVSAIYNYAGTSDTTPPTVPSNVSAAAVSSSQINVSWTASTDNVGVAGYRVYRNGSLAGATSSLSYSDTGLTASTLYSYTVAAYDGAGNVSGQSAAATATTLTSDTTPPTVSITAPVANATVSTTVTVTATASDNVAVGDVQFQLDGVNLGADLTAPPYSISWDTTTASNGSHNLTVIAHDTSHNAATSAIVPVTVSNTTGSAPTNGLIGYWNFDEGTGSVAHDTSGSGYNGVVSGATWTTGKINSALNFGVNTNSVTTPNIALGKTFSLTAWVNPTALAQASYVRIAENYYWSGFYVGTNALGTGYKVIVNNGAGATGTCGVILGCAEGGLITSGWHLVTATYDGATARLYVDTVLVGTDTFTAPGNTSLPLSIGHSSYGNAFNGAIDEVRLYNRALTATEVTGIYSYTGTQDTIPPTVPSNVSAVTVSISQINVSWSASTDNVGVAGYRVYRNGSLAGTTSSLSYSDTGLTASTLYSYTVAAYDGAGNVSSQSAAATATTLTPDTTPPTVSIIAPVANASVSNTITVTATASDNVAVADVQFQLDGVNLGPDLTTPPYSILWNTTTASNGSHNLTAIAHDTSHNAATSAIVPVTVGAPPTNGLIGYWNFDEASGSVAHDTSGSGYNGVVSGATWTMGKINSALKFSVNTNSVTTPSIALGNTFSLTAWVNPTVLAQASYVRIAENYYWSGFYVGTNAAGTAYKLIMSNGSGATGSCGGLALGCAEGGTITSGWHLVTATYDGTTARLYVDNALVGSDTFTAPGNTNLPLYIGHSSYGNAFNGAIDEVRLYNRALTATEVSAIYSYAGTPDTTPPSIPSNVSAAAVSSFQINVSWTASTDNVGVVGYRVYRNGSQIGTTSSLSYSDTGLTASTLYSYTVAAYDGAGNVSSQSAAATATTLIPDTTPPTVFITAPVINASVSNSVTVTATASDNVAVGDVQFQLDGVNLGADLTAPPYSILWNTTTASNGSHNLTAIAHDTSHNAATSAIVPVTVSNTIGLPPTNGLIGYWNFDEDSGSVAHDTSGSGYNGAVSGATWTTGKINSALNFSVNTNSVATPSIALGNTFSFSAWVNPTVLAQTSYVRIAETYYATGFYLGTNAAGTAYKFIMSNGAGATGSCGGLVFGCAEGGTITSGWHLVTATYDGATARLYVDDVLVGSDTFTAPGNTNLPLYIGHSSYGNAFNGAIDEVRLYNRALTPTEVTAIYN